MEALLTSFVAAFLAEWGDKTQWLVVALAARFARPVPVLAGVAVAALANALIASAGGIIVHDLIVARAAALLLALALLFVGGGGLFRAKEPNMGATWRTGPFLTAAGCFFLLEFGDKTQFTAFALATYYDSLALTAAGASAGVIAASLPAILLARDLPRLLPLRGIRVAIAALFLLAGLVVAVGALRLA